MGGGSSSTVTTNNKQLYINNDTMNMLNKNISTNVSNTIISTASNCAANAVNTATIDISGIHADGDVEITDVAQDQSIKLNFSCVQQSKAQNNMQADLVNKMMSTLTSTAGAEILAKMDAKAESSNKTGFGAIPGGGGSNSTVNQNLDLTVQNNSVKNIQNVVENTVVNNFNQETVNSCVSNFTNAANMKISDVTSGKNVRIRGLTQKQAIDSIAKCEQISDAANKTMSQIMNATGVVAESSNTVKSTTDITGSATSKNVADGPFESIGNMIGSVLGGLGGLFGGGMIGYLISCCCVCLVAVLVLGGGYYATTQLGGGDDGYSCNNGYIINSYDNQLDFNYK